MSLKSLIAIIVSTNYLFCCAAHQSKPIVIGNYQEIDKGFQEINPEHPPTDGVWATWKDATAISNNNRIERAKLEVDLAAMERDKNIAQNQLQVSDKKANSFFNKYGLPLGFFVGIGASVAIIYGTKGH